MKGHITIGKVNSTDTFLNEKIRIEILDENTMKN